MTQKTQGPDTWNYEWNTENQLVRVNKNGAEVASYGYDPFGRRVARVESGNQSGWTYDSEGSIREAGSSTTRHYVQAAGVDEPLASVEGAEYSFFLRDGLSSVATLATPSGTSVQERRYDAWGQPEVGGERSGFSFTSREWEPATGLYYYRARYYVPTLGRFMSEDPIRFGGGANFYSYVRARVATRWDPFGLAGEDYWGTVVCKGQVAVPQLNFDILDFPDCGIPECVVEHEKRHACDFNKRQECKGKPDGHRPPMSSKRSA
jgi:RHS repeat-associated protein